MSGERMALVSDQDVEFVRLAREHYRIFAEASERQDQTRTAGIMRTQEFRAERFLERLGDSGGGS